MYLATKKSNCTQAELIEQQSYDKMQEMVVVAYGVVQTVMNLWRNISFFLTEPVWNNKAYVSTLLSFILTRTVGETSMMSLN